MKNHRSFLILIAYTSSIISIFLILIFFHLRGVVYYDEGYILNSALRIADGQVPYRDFDMVYTPISYLTTAAFLKIFGESIFSGRLAALTISIVSLFALYKILQLITKDKLLIVLSLFFFIAWGPAHINFPWPVMFALCLLLYATLYYLKGSIQKKPNYFFIVGVIGVICFFTKQNFGTILIITSLFCFLFLDKNNRKTYLIRFLIGVLSSALAAIVLLISTASIYQFIDNMYFYTLKKIIIEKALDTPFLYEGSVISKFGKLIFYLSPLIFSIMAWIVARKSKRQLFLISIFTAVFYLIGIRPTTDYVHLAPLLALAGINLTILVQQTKNQFISRLTVLIFILLTLFGFYKAYYSGYYKWEDPLYTQTILQRNSRLQIYLSRHMTITTDKLISFLSTHTKPDDYIYVHYYEPLIYFVSDRKNPTRFDFTFQLTSSDQKEIIHNLQEKKVKLIILHNNSRNERSIITNYVKSNYYVAQKIDDYLLYMKKK